MLPDSCILANSESELISLTFGEQLLNEEFDGSACLLARTNL